MFGSAHLAGLNISSFDTSAVTDMSSMFVNFNMPDNQFNFQGALDLSHFNTSQ